SSDLAHTRTVEILRVCIKHLVGGPLYAPNHFTAPLIISIKYFGVIRLQRVAVIINNTLSELLRLLIHLVQRRITQPGIKIKLRFGSVVLMGISCYGQQKSGFKCLRRSLRKASELTDFCPCREFFNRIIDVTKNLLIEEFYRLLVNLEHSSLKFGKHFLLIVTVFAPELYLNLIIMRTHSPNFGEINLLCPVSR